MLGLQQPQISPNSCSFIYLIVRLDPQPETQISNDKTIKVEKWKTVKIGCRIGQKDITLFKSITMLYGTNNISRTFFHITSKHEK